MNEPFKALPVHVLGGNFEAELHALGKALETPEHPVVAIVGGAKISTKLALLRHLIEKVDSCGTGKKLNRQLVVPTLARRLVADWRFFLSRVPRR